MSEKDSSRIKFAYFHSTWNALANTHSELEHAGRKITPDEYLDEMHGKLFCPGCFEAITRAPRDKSLFSNGRRACFSHLGSTRHIRCDLRSTKPEGKQYLTQEEASRAIANDELVVISSFLSEPVGPEFPAGIYDQTPVEDQTGPVSEVPISRHTGQTFRLPTKLSTVEALCRRFDSNLYKYFVFPGSSNAVRLIDALADIRSIDSTTTTPRLYFGRIESSFNAGRTPKPTNLRMTKLSCHPMVKDFYVKVIDRLQGKRGITDDSKDRRILFWGKIGINGIGLCVEDLEWGQFALLPQKYEKYLPAANA